MLTDEQLSTIVNTSPCDGADVRAYRADFDKVIAQAREANALRAEVTAYDDGKRHMLGWVIVELSKDKAEYEHIAQVHDYLESRLKSLRSLMTDLARNEGACR